MNPSRFALLAFALWSLPAVAATDSVTIGTVTATGTVVVVPVYVRDVSGTPLGSDQGVNRLVQDWQIQVDYAPASAITSVVFQPSGINASIPAANVNTVYGPGTAKQTLFNFQSALALTLDAHAPGDKVGELVFTLSPSATPGTTITLTLDPHTFLDDYNDDIAESTGDGFLTLVNGAINVPQPALPAMSAWALMALAVTLALFGAMRIRP
jgi:hypothetical protein